MRGLLARVAARLRRVPRWVWAATAVAVLTFGFFTHRWILAPSTVAVDDVGDADAVVLFVGGRGERLETATELVEAGVAPVLVIPNGTVRRGAVTGLPCDSLQRFELLCPKTASDDTRGEARVIADLAVERGWDRLVMVTSTYHVTRAELLLDRCFDGDIVAVEASPSLSVVDLGQRVSHEWLGLVQAHVLRRGC